MSYLEYNTPIYDSLEIHNLMLSDSVRMGTYALAIEANVKEGDTVVDVGTGTGILALLSIKAGAKKVYAIEPTKIIEVAKQIAKSNGLEDKIEFMNCTAEEAELPERVDCIISEWMGVFGLQENMLFAVTSVRDRYLKSNGKILPHDVSLYVALVSSDRIYNETVGRWKQPFHGFDYRYFADCNADDTHLITARPDELVSEPVMLMELDIRNVEPQRLYEESIKIVVKESTKSQGVLGWFSAGFPNGITLDTSPYELVTHWQQLFFPFKNPIKLGKNDEVSLTFKMEEDKKDYRLMNFAWDVSTP